ncbi:MAG: choice-of-anchor B family protein [Candidatus Promineifilaceae bacterium]
MSSVNKQMHKWLLFVIGLAITIVLTFATRLTINAAATTPCVSGSAGIYPCENVDLLAHLPLTAIGAEDASVTGSDHWFWRDSVSGRDFVLFGLSNGTSFIDISNPQSPQYLGKLPTHSGTSRFRDIKVYNDHAFIIGDQIADHGMQIFDLTQLRPVTTTTTFTETAHYDGFGAAHNFWINEGSGFAYLLRAGDCIGTQMLDLSTPTAPTDAGCFADDGAASDTECVLYTGPDTTYSNREICFTGSDDSWTIADVTDKSAPVQITSETYSGIRRAHQTILSADQRYMLLSDTMDEAMDGVNTTLYIWDVADLDNPTYLGLFRYDTNATDHNIYVKDGYSYQVNWKAGLRVLDISRLPDITFDEVAYFDVEPTSDAPGMGGSWGVIPWWENGVVTVSSLEGGLFVLQVTTPLSAVQVGAISAETTLSTPSLLTFTLALLLLTFYITHQKHPTPQGA